MPGYSGSIQHSPDHQILGRHGHSCHTSHTHEIIAESEHHLNAHRQLRNHARWESETQPQDDISSELDQNSKRIKRKFTWSGLNEPHSKGRYSITTTVVAHFLTSGRQKSGDTKLVGSNHNQGGFPAPPWAGLKQHTPTEYRNMVCNRLDFAPDAKSDYSGVGHICFGTTG
jgi:hypothetical protein